jgi:hypothetical protein
LRNRERRDLIFTAALSTRPQREAPMAAKLVGLVFVVLAIATAGRALAEEPAPTLDPAVGLNAYAALVDQDIAHARAALRGLAATEEARSDDWSRIKGPLAVLAQAMPEAAVVWYARADGTHYTAAAGPSGQTLRDRAYFQVLMAGREVAGVLVVSKATGRNVAVVAVPVGAGGRVTGALGVSLDLEKVALRVDKALALPPSLMFYALDETGRTALHRETSRIFEKPGEAESPSLAAAVKEMLAKPEGSVRYEFQGAQRTAIYLRSRETQWVYALRW